MDLIWEKFTEWLKELLVGGIMDNLTGLFDNVNAKVAEAAGHIGSTPQAWNANIYSMIRSLSDNVILPIAGVILAFVMTLELIQLIADRNNLHDIDTWVFFRWVFKTAAAVLIVSNTWNIVMGVFEAAQSVVNRASGLIVGNTSINLADHIADLEARLLEMNVWSLLGLWLHGHHDGQGMGRHGAELSSLPVGFGVSGLSHHHLHRHLCGAGTEYAHRRQHFHGHLAVRGLYGAALLHPVQNQQSRKVNFQQSLGR